MQSIPKSVVKKIRTVIADKYGLPFLKKINMRRVSMLRLNIRRETDPEYRARWLKNFNESKKGRKYSKKLLEKMRKVAYNIQFTEGYKNRTLKGRKRDKTEENMRSIGLHRYGKSKFYESFDDEPTIKVVENVKRPNDYAGVLTMNDYAGMN